MIHLLWLRPSVLKSKLIVRISHFVWEKTRFSLTDDRRNFVCSFRTKMSSDVNVDTVWMTFSVTYRCIIIICCQRKIENWILFVWHRAQTIESLQLLSIHQFCHPNCHKLYEEDAKEIFSTCIATFLHISFISLSVLISQDRIDEVYNSKQQSGKNHTKREQKKTEKILSWAWYSTVAAL